MKNFSWICWCILFSSLVRHTYKKFSLYSENFWGKKKGILPCQFIDFRSFFFLVRQTMKNLSWICWCIMFSFLARHTYKNFHFTLRYFWSKKSEFYLINLLILEVFGAFGSHQSMKNFSWICWRILFSFLVRHKYKKFSIYSEIFLRQKKGILPCQFIDFRIFLARLARARLWKKNFSWICWCILFSIGLLHYQKCWKSLVLAV